MAIEQYADTIRRICFVYLKNHHDTEDIFQEVFLKYALRVEPFDSDAHTKAWFIRITINACKDTLKSYFSRKVSSLEELTDEPSYLPDDSRDILQAVIRLPENYRLVIYMFYYEGYSGVEIARLLHKKENTIYTWLARAKSQLKELLGGEFLGA